MQYQTFQHKKTNFMSKRRIYSFRDLEVYQRSSQLSAEVMSKVVPQLKEKQYPLTEQMVECSLNIPILITEAHARRFDDKNSSIEVLDKSMMNCNKMVAYLEQIKNIFGSNADNVLYDELIKNYLATRSKMFNLFKAWKQFQVQDNSRTGIEKMQPQRS